MNDLATRVAVFDIDGTLLTTGGAGAVAWQRAFEDLHSIAANISDYTEDGLPDHEVCRKTFVGVIGREPSESEIAALISKYLFHIADALRESTSYRVLPGVVELLDRLAHENVLLGITTGNVAGAAHLKLERGGLNRYFAFGGYGSDSPDRTALTSLAIQRAGRLIGRELDPAHVLVVGDTPHDVAAAHGAGALAVAVATGHFSVDQLRKAGGDVVLETVESGFPL